ncbi:MAG: TIGR02996 domain-containing protein [Kofleriaceae bacterium]
MNERELVAAIANAPDDDAPRSVYADWLMERGDPLGELIAVQCALARADATDEPLADEPTALALEAALRERHAARLLVPLRALAQLGYELRRGFVEHVVALREGDLLEHADELAVAAPLWRSLAVRGAIVEHPLPEAFARLTSLTLHELRDRHDDPDPGAMLRFARSPRLAGLRRLHIGNVRLPGEVIAALLELSGPLVHLGFELGPPQYFPYPLDGAAVLAFLQTGRAEALRSLTLAGIAIDDGTLEVIGELPGLETLVLRGCTASAGGLVALASRLHGLRELDLEWERQPDDASLELGGLVAAMPALRRLRLCGEALSEHELASIAHEPSASRLRRLELDVGPHREVARAIATSAALRGLVRLVLRGAIDDETRAQIAARCRLVYQPPPPDYPEEIIEELRARRLVSAVRMYREWTGAGLLEGKLAVVRIGAELGVWP